MLVPFHFSFSFYALNMDDSLKVKKALFMFVDLFGTERFEYETLVRFIITIRKNYRQVKYRDSFIIKLIECREDSCTALLSVSN